MKGYLQKTETEQGWVVLYEQQDPSAEDGMLPLYFNNDRELVMDDKQNLSFYSGKEVEFEIIKLYDDKYGHELIYAKLIRKTVEIDENGKPLTYWGGLAKPDIEKLAEEVYGKGVNYDYEEGFVDGYNKAKETLYTEFDVIKAFEHGWNQRHYGIDDEILLREIQNNLIKSLKQPNEL
jgi:hypothetical protein